MNWGDILYPGNPERRQEVIDGVGKVALAVHKIYSSIEVYAEVLTDSFPDYTPVPSFNMDMTYQDNFNGLNNVLNQWNTVANSYSAKAGDEARELKDVVSSIDVTTAESISSTMGNLESKAIFSTKVAADLVTGILATNVAYNAVAAAVESAALAGISGLIVGSVVTVGIDLIIGAIVGAKERSDLQSKIDTLTDAYNKILPMEANCSGVASAVTHALWNIEEKTSMSSSERSKQQLRLTQLLDGTTQNQNKAVYDAKIDEIKRQERDKEWQDAQDMAEIMANKL